ISGPGGIGGPVHVARMIRHRRTNLSVMWFPVRRSGRGPSRGVRRIVEITRYSAADTDVGRRTTTGCPRTRAARGPDLPIFLPSRRGSLAGLTAVCCAVLSPAAAFAQPVKNDDKLPVIPPAEPAGQTLSLGECLAIAQERQPSIRGALHSQAASQHSY